MKKKTMTIHIEEKLAGETRGLCYAKLQWDERLVNENMTTKMSLATCPKCIEIRKARVAKAVETRQLNKAIRQRLEAEADGGAYLLAACTKNGHL